jgi:8-oxo-dGTP pyrophosphatase MutT (NUDIX family)
MRWPALNAALQRDDRLRLPFWVGESEAGSVPRAALEVLAAWPQWLDIAPSRVSLKATHPDEALAVMNAQLRQQGWVRAWRNELFAICDLATGRYLACTERAACRFWGTLTLGAHANGYVADEKGAPTHLWVARRSLTKATDPGLHDNLIGGGVAMGQTPREALEREGWEEAGLLAQHMAAAQPGRVLRLHREVAEGLQREDLHSFDLKLAATVEPQNQDGEVHSFACMPIAGALALAASGAMTVDAELVTLDFALRHCLLPQAEADKLHSRLQPLLA